MNYGLPYKGSKNKIAAKILQVLPKRKRLYDLFCGGCAITHAAMLSDMYEEYHINDINWMCPQLFSDAISGKFANEDRWISREDFHNLKDKDPYVAFVWSFGNNLRDYLYGKHVEPLKKALHYAVFFKDYTLAFNLGFDLSFLHGIASVKDRYACTRRYLDKHKTTLPNGGGAMQSLERLKRIQLTDAGMLPGSQAESVPKESGKGINTSLESFTSLDRIRVIAEKRAQGSVLFASHGDYQQVKIEPQSVIYCDIPYKGTNVYDKKNTFDYERFYDWACSQTEPVFISEYQMPEDRFECIAEFAHRSLICATQNKAVTERLFVPKGQKL